jgi:molecular chaperone GrpE
MPDEGQEPPAAKPAASNSQETASSETEESPDRQDWATRYKYLLADFENYRRRAERERETLTRQARAGLLRELLPILEGFRTAEESLGHLPTSHPVRKGLEILDREWMTFLKHEGVEPVASPGRPFRADEAEAVGEADASPDRPSGTIAEVVQQGYRFYGGLLRPAKVTVARERPVAPAVEPETSGERSPEES